MWDAGGTDGGRRPPGRRKRLRGELTAVTVETSSTHTAVSLPARRVVMATRKTSGYRRRQGDKQRREERRHDEENSKEKIHFTSP